MSKLGWFLAGIGVGALALREYRENPRAQEAVDEIYSAAKEFGAAVTAGYKERESELNAPKPQPKRPATKKPAAKKTPAAAAKKS